MRGITIRWQPHVAHYEEEEEEDAPAEVGALPSPPAQPSFRSGQAAPWHGRSRALAPLPPCPHFWGRTAGTAARAAHDSADLSARAKQDGSDGMSDDQLQAHSRAITKQMKGGNMLGWHKLRGVSL